MGDLVTIAIPTFNRCNQLQRTIESVLAQDYQPIELIISDNASTDGTRDLCERYAEKHPSIRYVRHETNRGPTANFDGLRALATGEYFAFLGDDDWFDPSYVSRCVRFHQENPGYSIVSGRVWYHRSDGAKGEPHPITLEHERAEDRVAGYARTVRGNGVFYGVVPVGFERAIPPLQNVQGGDMLHVMGLAFLGKVRTLDDVGVHRTVEGATVSLANVAAILGLGWFQMYAPQIAIAYWFFRDVAYDSPLYARLGWRRWLLAARAGGIVFVRFVPPAVLKFVRLSLRAVRRRLTDRPSQRPS